MDVAPASPRAPARDNASRLFIRHGDAAGIFPLLLLISFSNPSENWGQTAILLPLVFRREVRPEKIAV